MNRSREEMLALAERCEKATGPDRELSASIALAVNDWLHEVEGNKPLNCRVRNAFGSPVYIGGETGRMLDCTASIDAAMTLVPEGHVFCVTNVGVDHPAEPDWSRASAIVGRAADPGRGYTVAATPALALCAAALRTLARENDGG